MVYGFQLLQCRLALQLDGAGLLRGQLIDPLELLQDPLDVAVDCQLIVCSLVTFSSRSALAGFHLNAPSKVLFLPNTARFNIIISPSSSIFLIFLPSVFTSSDNTQNNHPNKSSSDNKRHPQMLRIPIKIKPLYRNKNSSLQTTIFDEVVFPRG